MMKLLIVKVNLRLLLNLAYHSRFPRRYPHARTNRAQNKFIRAQPDILFERRLPKQGMLLVVDKISTQNKPCFPVFSTKKLGWDTGACTFLLFIWDSHSDGLVDRRFFFFNHSQSVQ